MRTTVSVGTFNMHPGGKILTQLQATQQSWSTSRLSQGTTTTLEQPFKPHLMPTLSLSISKRTWANTPTSPSSALVSASPMTQKASHSLANISGRVGKRSIQFASSSLEGWWSSTSVLRLKARDPCGDLSVSGPRTGRNGPLLWLHLCTIVSPVLDSMMRCLPNKSTSF